MYAIVPFQWVANHKFSAKLPIDNGNTLLEFRMRYNELAGYWTVDISKDDDVVYSGLPLIPSQNVLEQVSYLKIGSAWIIPKSKVEEQWPHESTGSDWYVLWGDSNG